jgi:hypothetical protein
MEIKIAKLKVRRGSNNDRKNVVLDQGELVHTLDTKRLFVGNGVLSGGDVVGNKNHLPASSINSLSTIEAEVGDLVTVDSKFYQLNALPSTNTSNWIPLTSNILEMISLSSLSASQINPLTVNNGLKIENQTLQTNFNTNFFQISSNQLSIKFDAFDEREIKSSSFGNGISGGSGNKISLNVDSQYFSFNTGKLTFNTSLSSSITNVDVSTITNVGGVISQTNIAATATSEIPSIEVDDFGRVISTQSSVFDTLTGFDAVNPIFNGTPLQSLSGGVPGLSLTTLSAISANDTGTTVVVLSSAGFLVFEGNDISRNGQEFGRFAIPIFTY